MMKNIYLWGFVLSFFSSVLPASSQSMHPNVILIMTDDQGYGDLGYTGNPHLQTPHLDALAKESIRFSQFYVSPVCAPTRSSLMTGRYSLRTGVRDTYNGGAIMATEEVTIAEMLRESGYNTGIFGKWHLGDNYPSRPMDQGFDESVTHLSGGMGQVGDWTTFFQGDSSYYDPVLWHNGTQKSYQGYCSDIFTDEALNFIQKNHSSPFFCYLSFNAPHTPLQVPAKYYQQYEGINPGDGFGKDERPFAKMSEEDKEDARKVYAMVTNIDDNVGRVLQKLEELNIQENTIFIFMTDNGPQQIRYATGLRGRKSSVYRGGVNVPFFLRFPSRFKNDQDIETMAAHIDVLPTLAALCDVALPKGRVIDGRNLLPLLEAGPPPWWTHRSLFFNWTRRYPELYNNVAMQKGTYRLVGHANYNASIKDLELFDIDVDPYEQFNIVQEKPKVAQQLKEELDQVYTELIQSKNLIYQPHIIIGSQHENPVTLNRNDADGQRGIWAQEEVFGKWNVQIQEGHYNVAFKFIKPVEGGGRLTLESGTQVNQMICPPRTTDLIQMDNVFLQAMEGEVIPFYVVNGKRIFPFWVAFEKIN